MTYNLSYCLFVNYRGENGMARGWHYAWASYDYQTVAAVRDQDAVGYATIIAALNTYQDEDRIARFVMQLNGEL